MKLNAIGIRIFWLILGWLVVAMPADGFYDPSLGRWINRDPIAERGGINLHVFVLNNPLSALDSYGDQGVMITIRRDTPSLRDLIQRFTFLGGRCCNSKSQSDEFALVGGSWQRLGPGECTDLTADCDGMTCNGGFYAVYTRNANCTAVPDHSCFASRRWTPNKHGDDSEPPVGDYVFPGRGSRSGNTPDGYHYRY